MPQNPSGFNPLGSCERRGKTPWFDYALRDFRNKAVLADKATAKAICDASRRAYCASAAFFSLNYETYVNEEFEPQDEPVGREHLSQLIPLT